jgi:[acyl-carrier-protein] S-malonyltransferase
LTGGEGTAAKIQGRKLGVIFTGQGFDIGQVRDFDARLNRHPHLVHQYEDVFGRRCPSAATCDYSLNEDSVLALILSAFENGEANPELRDRALVASGFSVGFYLALWYAGVLNKTSVARLLFRRCKAMNEAARVSASGMAVVLGIPIAQLEKMIAEFPVPSEEALWISNDNAPGNVTVAGYLESVSNFADFAVQNGAYKVVPLSTSGAWHTPLMKPAVESLRASIAAEPLGRESLLLIENVLAGPFPQDRCERTDLLSAHLWKRVRWRDCVRAMVERGATEFIELTDFDMLTKLGPGISRQTKFASAGVVQ